MTLHEPKRPRSAPRPRREPPPMKLGDLLGEQVRAINAERARRAELDAMGFTPLKSEP